MSGMMLHGLGDCTPDHNCGCMQSAEMGTREIPDRLAAGGRPMTGPEHYRRAEALLDNSDRNAADLPPWSDPAFIPGAMLVLTDRLAALVHATLAEAAVRVDSLPPGRVSNAVYKAWKAVVR